MNDTRAYLIIELLTTAGFIGETEDAMINLDRSGLSDVQVKNKLREVETLYHEAAPHVIGCPPLPNLFKEFNNVTHRSKTL